MSAFSNWNGPEGFGGGPSLPQIKTLEELILAINNVNQRITDVLGGSTAASVPNQIAAHNSNVPNGTNPGAHSDIRQLISSLSTSLGSLYYSKLDSDAKYATKGTDSDLSTKEDKASFQANGVYDQSKVAKLAQFAAGGTYDQSLLAVKTQVATDITAAVTELSNSLAALVETAELATDTIKQATSGHGIMVEDVLVLKKYAKLAQFIDFTRWCSVDTASTRAISKRQGPPNMTAIIGMLSEDFKIPASAPTFGGGEGGEGGGEGEETTPPVPVSTKHVGVPGKPARAFIKFMNTLNFTAIVDMTVAGAKADGSDAVGALHGILAKSKSDNNIITLGLYHGTTDGFGHTYLGISAHSVDELGNVHDTTSALFGEAYAVGENFIPQGQKGFVTPNGAVSLIGSLTLTADGGMVYDTLNVKELVTTKLVDDAGHTVFEVSEIGDANINIGNIAHDLQIRSKSRPVVKVGTDTEELAFKSDLASNLFWQEAVDVIVDDNAQMSGLGNAIYFDPAHNYKKDLTGDSLILVKNDQGTGLPVLYKKNGAIIKQYTRPAVAEQAYQWGGAHRTFKGTTAADDVYISGSFAVWSPDDTPAWSYIDLAVLETQLPIGSIINCRWDMIGSLGPGWELCDGTVATTPALATWLGDNYGPAGTKPWQDNAVIRSI